MTLWYCHFHYLDTIEHNKIVGEYLCYQSFFLKQIHKTSSYLHSMTHGLQDSHYDVVIWMTSAQLIILRSSQGIYVFSPIRNMEEKEEFLSISSLNFANLYIWPIYQYSHWSFSCILFLLKKSKYKKLFFMTCQIIDTTMLSLPLSRHNLT